MSGREAPAGPSNTWRVGRYRFGRYRPWMWECSDGSLGSFGSTPISALVRQMKWKRRYRRNPEAWPPLEEKHYE